MSVDGTSSGADVARSSSSTSGGHGSATTHNTHSTTTLLSASPPSSNLLSLSPSPTHSDLFTTTTTSATSNSAPQLSLLHHSPPTMTAMTPSTAPNISQAPAPTVNHTPIGSSPSSQSLAVDGGGASLSSRERVRSFAPATPSPLGLGASSSSPNNAVSISGNGGSNAAQAITTSSSSASLAGLLDARSASSIVRGDFGSSYGPYTYERPGVRLSAYSAFSAYAASLSNRPSSLYAASPSRPRTPDTPSSFNEKFSTNNEKEKDRDLGITMKEKSPSAALSPVSATYARRDRGETFLAATGGANRDSMVSMSRDSLFNFNPRLSRVSTSTDLTDVEVAEREIQLHLPLHMGSSLPAYVDYEDDYFAPLPHLTSSLHPSHPFSDASYAKAGSKTKPSGGGAAGTSSNTRRSIRTLPRVILSKRGFLNFGTLLILLLALLSLFLVYPVAHFSVTAHPDPGIGINVGVGGSTDSNSATLTPSVSSTNSLELPVPTTTDPDPLIPGPIQTA